VIPEWPQQHGVDQTEDGAVGADAGRERQDGDQREHRRLDQAAHCMPQIE
jgi:hypothetical protein